MSKQTLTMAQLFREMGFDPETLEENVPVNVSELKYEILSRDDQGNNCWKLIKNIVKKTSAEAYVVPGRNLEVSGDHRFWAADTRDNIFDWRYARDLVGKQFFLVSENGDWIRSTIEKTEKVIGILDLEVADTECYFSNGVLSHNTIHGDPLVSPGGKAIPYHASVRLRLTSGLRIKNANDEVIGIKVIASNLKNKVARPFRKCEFEILFGVGINEDEYLFDDLRDRCSKLEHKCVVVDGIGYQLAGDGGWKTISVIVPETGEVLKDKNFRKAEFGALRKNPEWKSVVDIIIDGCLVIKKASTSEIVIAEGENPSDDGSTD